MNYISVVIIEIKKIMNFDFVIIGTGPAGSILAWKLSNLGYRIAMIDRAKFQEQRLINDFFCPYVNKSPNYYTPVYSDQLGGNSALWHSKIYLISEREYDKKKWGFEYEELKLYSSDLADKLNIEKQKLTEIFSDKKSSYHFAIRSDLKNVFKLLKLDKNENIKIFKGFSPIKINLKNENANSIEIISFKKKKEKLFINQSLIFCAGGIGNPHLLMNLFSDNNKLIGTNLSDHAHVNLCKINSNQLNKYEKILKPSIKNNLKFYDIKKKREELAQVFEENKFFAGVQLDYKIDPMRKIRRIFLRINNIYLRKILNFFSFFILKFNGFFAKIGLLFNKYHKYSFEFFFSQHQDNQNHLVLDEKQLDNYGLKKVNIIWDLTDKDKEKINDIIQKSVGKFGKLYQSNIDVNFTKNFYNHGLAGLHPSCTTKIGLNEKDGVVDNNLKLFGFNNIYVCGSSCFPENGFTNPTWTIMTLANRLASFLAKQFKK